MSKFYVVWVGRQPGIYKSWSDTHSQVNAFPKAKFKSFEDEHEAKNAYEKGEPIYPTKKTKKETKTAKEKVAIENMDIHIYCDGGCEPNPGNAGSGVVVYENNQLKSLFFGLYNSNGTNNTAELTALTEALRIAQYYTNQNKKVQILSDSMYAINCVTRWAKNWCADNWVKPVGEIKNVELIKEAYFLFELIQNSIVISHIKAHSGFEGNELADRMSIMAITNKEEAFKQLEPPFNIQKILDLRVS